MLQEFYRYIDSVKEGPERTAAYNDAIKKIDELGNPYDMLRLRSSMVVMTPFYDDAVKILPRCAEFFEIAEEYPEAADADDIFAVARGAVNLTIALPQIEKSTCEKMLKRMEEAAYVVRSGALRRFHEAAAEFYAYIDWDKAQEHFDIFENEKMGLNSACTACEQSFKVWYAIQKGDIQKADKLAAKIFNGVYVCHDVPWQTYAFFLEHYVNAGEIDNNKKIVEKLLKGGCRDVSDIANLGVVLMCLAHLNPNRGINILQHYLHWSTNLWNKQGLYYFYKGAWCVCEAAKDLKTSIFVPQGHPLEKSKISKTEDCANWFYNQAKKIAESFDNRNGTDFYKRNLEMCKNI